MNSVQELRQHRSTLLFARKLLTFAALLQLPFLVELLLRQADLLLQLHILGGRQMPGKLTALLWGATATCAIVGFTMVCRQLSLWEGDLENTEFARRTRLLGSRKIAASIQFFFYLTFFVPLFNLVAVFWARSQAANAIRDLEQLLPTARR